MAGYHELEQFLSGSFHQDWTLDAKDEETVVAGYLARAASEKKRRVARQIARLLEANRTEIELTAALTSMGCYYRPEGDGRTPSEWLRELCARLTPSKDRSG